MKTAIKWVCVVSFGVAMFITGWVFKAYNVRQKEEKMS